MEIKTELEKELESANSKCMDRPCCRSYLSEKGRCFDCVERTD